MESGNNTHKGNKSLVLVKRFFFKLLFGADVLIS